MNVSELATIRWDLIGPVIGIQMILMLVALVDVLRNPQLAGSQRWIWLLVVVFIGFIGPIAYFVWGRRERV